MNQAAKTVSDALLGLDFMKELGFGYGEVEKRGIVSPVA